MSQENSSSGPLPKKLCENEADADIKKFQQDPSLVLDLIDEEVFKNTAVASISVPAYSGKPTVCVLPGHNDEVKTLIDNVLLKERLSQLMKEIQIINVDSLVTELVLESCN